jgi:hypothetical protein
MIFKKQLVISYFKMAGISFFAGLQTLACYNIFLSLLGSSEKGLFLSSLFAYVTGVVANFFMQSLNGSHRPTARKMLLFTAINISTAALASITSAYLITAISLNNDRFLINVLYSLIVVAISPLTFFLYSIALKNESVPGRNKIRNNRNNI